MYDTSLTHMALPSECYRLLLGTAVSVFCSNNNFIIENIINTDNSYTWHELIDLESGQLKSYISSTITQTAGPEIAETFFKIVNMRNRFVHSFQCTSPEGEQILVTKELKTGKQFEITKEFLVQFILLNDELSRMLHAYRGH